MKVTREQILETARRHFARTGYRHTSLAAVAEELGVVKGALYYHVPGGKKEMLDAVISREEAHMLEHMSLAAAAEPDACHALRAAIKAKVGVVRDRRRELGATEEVLEEIKLLMASEQRPFHEQELALFDRILSKGEEQGCIRSLRHREVATRAIQALVRHVEMQEAYNEEDSDLLESLLDLLQFGVERHS